MEAMAENPRKLNAKIAYLCGRAGVGPSELARIAGVTPASGAAYLKDATPSTPSAVALARIADHFNVSMRWFLDDEAAIDEPQTDAQRLIGGELWHEIARRYRLEIIKVLDAIEATEKSIDRSTVKALFEQELADGWPDQVDKRMEIVASGPSWLQTIAHVYSVENQAWQRHAELPGADRSPNELLLSAVIDRARSLIQKKPELLWVDHYTGLLSLYGIFPDRRARYEEHRTRAIEAIDQGKTPDPLDDPLLVDEQMANPGGLKASYIRDEAVRRREEMRRQGFKF